ncbi:hypothetical protein Dimus_019944 [Dionaea muscipula]
MHSSFNLQTKLKNCLKLHSCPNRIKRVKQQISPAIFHLARMSICSSRLNAWHFQSLTTATNEVNSRSSRSSRDFVVEIRVLGYFDRNAAPQSKPGLRVEAMGLDPWSGQNRRVIRLNNAHGKESSSRTASFNDESRGLDDESVVTVDDRGVVPESGGRDGGGADGSGGGGGGGGEEEEEEGKEFGSVLTFGEVMRECERRGASLPSDMLEAARTTGIRELILDRYLVLQGPGRILGFLMRHWAMLRNRMLADPAFLFKVGIEVVIDSCCATFAEVQKRGEEFWTEFELYLADILVGVVVDIALVSLLAPYVRIGRQHVSGGFLGGIQQACNSLPSSVFEAERPGSRFSTKQRIAAYFYKGVLYGLVGFGCGIIGQGIANLVMTAKRNMKKSDEDIPVPPLVKSAALWGVFLAVSSNTRYQIVNGLERLVEASPLARRIPPVAMAFTVGVRFANNIYGGMQFVDWAKCSGVQ